MVCFPFSFAEPNWGLPLAIAANLHIPYRIEIGIDNMENVDIKDRQGKGKGNVLLLPNHLLLFDCYVNFWDCQVSLYQNSYFRCDDIYRCFSPLLCVKNCVKNFDRQSRASNPLSTSIKILIIASVNSRVHFFFVQTHLEPRIDFTSHVFALKGENFYEASLQG